MDGLITDSNLDQLMHCIETAQKYFRSHYVYNLELESACASHWCVWCLHSHLYRFMYWVVNFHWIISVSIFQSLSRNWKLRLLTWNALNLVLLVPLHLQSSQIYLERAVGSPTPKYATGVSLFQMSSEFLPYVSRVVKC